MTKLDKLLVDFSLNGVEFQKVKDVYTRLKGALITAAKMRLKGKRYLQIEKEIYYINLVDVIKALKALNPQSI